MCQLALLFTGTLDWRSGSSSIAPGDATVPSGDTAKCINIGVAISWVLRIPPLSQTAESTFPCSITVMRGEENNQLDRCIHRVLARFGHVVPRRIHILRSLLQLFDSKHVGTKGPVRRW
jgi:hypothetical protein